MTTYSVNGKGHRMLARLEVGEAAGAALVHAAVGNNTRNKRAKAWRTLDALRRDDLVRLEAGFYHLTVEGRDALVCLRSGRPAVIETAVPSVRVFVERRAA